MLEMADPTMLPMARAGRRLLMAMTTTASWRILLVLLYMSVGVGAYLFPFSPCRQERKESSRDTRAFSDNDSVIKKDVCASLKDQQGEHEGKGVVRQHVVHFVSCGWGRVTRVGKSVGLNSAVTWETASRTREPSCGSTGSEAVPVIHLGAAPADTADILGPVHDCNGNWA